MNYDRRKIYSIACIKDVELCKPRGSRVEITRHTDIHRRMHIYQHKDVISAQNSFTK